MKKIKKVTSKGSIKRMWVEEDVVVHPKQEYKLDQEDVQKKRR